MQKIIFIAVICFFVLPIELYLSGKSIYVTNSIICGLFYFTSLILTLLAIILFSFNYKTNSYLVLIFGFLLIIPFNLYYLKEFDNLKSYSEKVVHWAYTEKIKSKAFPTKLTTKHDKRIVYTVDNDSFTVFFFVISSNTGHFYSSKSGWGFMDD